MVLIYIDLYSRNILYGTSLTWNEFAVERVNDGTSFRWNEFEWDEFTMERLYIFWDEFTWNEFTMERVNLIPHSSILRTYG